MSGRIIQQIIRMVGPRVAAMLAPVISSAARIGAQRLAIAIPTAGALILLPITFPIGFAARTVEEKLREQNKEDNSLDDVPMSQRRDD